MMDEEGTEHDLFSFLLMCGSSERGALEEYNGVILASPRGLASHMTEPITYTIKDEDSVDQSDNEVDDEDQFIDCDS